MSEAIDEAVIRAQLDKTLGQTDFPELGEKYEGKVRDCYVRDGQRTLIATDRISAFDVVLGTIPFKGQVLNQMAAFWFEATADLVPNHVINVPDPTVTVARECQLLPVEFVMRSYLTGVTSTSIWTHYSKGGAHFCGHELPDGMKKNQRLPKAILTPSTKAEKGDHDSRSRAPRSSRWARCRAADFDAAAEMCARVFAFGQQEALRRGLILVDTKYEIGRRPTARCASSTRSTRPIRPRYWYATTTTRASRAARSRAASTRSTSAARSPTRATRATARRQAVRRRPRRGRAPLHPGVRAGDGPAVRARHRRAERRGIRRQPQALRKNVRDQIPSPATRGEG
jgi:phosphoribosylaminoimidazole-succinocarboxamide synthase